ncbi:MAG: PASTA domain-containing protein [Candidatus Neomarinimicrobiota bacterium]|jgi:serine/threonine-protein kinase|nr:PASTA domain-containing protein [Candidatus Neomarinimicrobiota bacterium]HIB79978.1 PASTA domain-containing protein [Candidatus Neomarinimicrobiota bacterium]
MMNKIIQFLIAFGIVSLAIILIFDWFIMPSYVRQDKTLIVTDITGKNLNRALIELETEGYKGVVYDTVYTADVNPQTVVDQYPVAGAKVKPGRTIRLKISRSEKLIIVPNLVGQSRRSVEISLQQIGLRIDTVYTEFNPDYPKGTVAWQFPKSGDHIKKGMGLQITVSQGLPPDFFQVPQLFGMSMQNAKDLLTKARLKVGKISYQQNEDLVPYTVLDQSIAPGTVLNQTIQVDLVVSILDLKDIFDKLSNEK